MAWIHLLSHLLMMVLLLRDFVDWYLPQISFSNILGFSEKSGHAITENFILNNVLHQLFQ